MKRTLIASTLLALAAGLAPAAADISGEASIAGGTLVVPSGAARAQRCANGSVPNGTFGWILNVTGGKLFSLTTPTPAIDDVNIGFYISLTPCDAAANIAGAYSNSFGNESGVVPSNATKAIIYSGSVPAPPEHSGYARPNTPFVYTETTP